MDTINKYKANYIGISKTVYAWNLGQAFQEAEIWGSEKGLTLLSITDLEQTITENKCPYFGIYQQFDNN
ncbi:hypothetical protein SAMN04489761_4312 [Tenacibaculum sp. MAR_2009_124]|uniref:hypothetical protein n=1 Tax=Tenacibaculum sp. MAR_2009_124 TaxID=1250059 RepID=UPI0008973F0E|nr:hypothetical protein [Tenacibaculum sp. MAR_2009_124]SED11235.1 hypothetical protein SAMN04489761_4312 [Tenacibaculum sp. MAR_2009_124]